MHVSMPFLSSLEVFLIFILLLFNEYAHNMVCACESEDNSVELVLSFRGYVGSRD